MNRNEDEGAGMVSKVSIGARNLGEEAVRKTLPTFDLLLKQIEQIRSSSLHVGNDNGIQTPPNNTIGIFGKRGTGKTSVLYTLINKLIPAEHNKQKHFRFHNHNLGIIEPDQFGDNTKIMGSIVGLLKKAAEKQIMLIKDTGSHRRSIDAFEPYFNKGIFIPGNPLQQQLNDLIEYHLYTESEYRNLLVHTYDDLATHIKKSSHLLTPDIEFKEKLHGLITCLVKNQRILLQTSQDNKIKIEPLFFIFIDDIDLKMTRSRELLEAVLQYANHPNVVTVLSGDYEILKESVMLDLIRDEQLHFSNLRPISKLNDKETIMDRKKNLAHEYIKKMIPPARRHQLLYWNNNTIPGFSFDNETLMDQLLKMFGESSLFSHRSVGEEKLQPITISYTLFDRTPRGIVNVYYHINEINQQFPLEMDEHRNINNPEWFNIVKALIDTIILSSTRLVVEQEFILEHFIRWGNNSSNSYIDYAALNYVIDEVNQNEKSTHQENLDLLLSLVLIGDIAKSLLINMKVDQNKCHEIQNHLFDSLLKSKDTKTKLGNIAESIIKHITFRNSLFFVDQASEHTEWLSYKKSEGNVHSESQEIQERWMFMLIATLLEKDKEPQLLVRLYLQLYQQNRNEKKLDYSRGILDFLSERSSRTELYDYYSNLYAYPQQDWSELIFSWVRNTTHFNELFVNMLIQLNSLDDHSFDSYVKEIGSEPEGVSATAEASRLKKILTNIQNQSKTQELSLTPNQNAAILRRIKKFYEDLLSRIRDDHQGLFEVEWKSSDSVNQAMDVFLNGTDGMKTKYKEVKELIKNKKVQNKYEAYADYIERRHKVSNLANNYRVWFGRKEADNLIKVLREQSFLAPKNFYAVELHVLRLLKPYLLQVNENIIQDQEYEAAKVQMRQNLSSAFEEAMSITSSELNALDMELWEDEDSEERENA
ncbi:hypothetical protein [Paenibacillus sp. TSA_86.1]|uniref:hypothetical protein n=1 Tax=Paenibacillus sp. TSA_86.1 TaxID=3415649 RepID=UPI0040454FEE